MTITCTPDSLRRQLLRLQWATLGWMVIECGLALFSAARAHSPALLAFGLDSLVELLSATLVLAAANARFGLRRRRINLAAGTLLFALAVVVAFTSVLAFAGRLKPEASPLGIAISGAALVLMPLLAWRKRRLARRTGNVALAADAVQSAACAYLAALTLSGVALNAALHLPSADAVAALVAIPILIIEARRAMRGQSCACCGTPVGQD